MALNTQYVGASPMATGASYFDSRAVLRVQEGYANGATTEYVDVGLFEVTDFTDSAPFKRDVQLSAERQDLRLSDMGSIPSRVFKTAYTLNETFKTFNDNYSLGTGTWDIAEPNVIGVTAIPGGSVTYLFLSSAGDKTFEGIDVLSPGEFRDVRVTTRMAASDMSPSEPATFSLTLYRIKSIPEIGFRGERVVYETQYIFDTGATNLAQIVRRDYLGATVIASGGFAGLSDNIFYYFRSEVVDNTIRMYLSSDNNTYTNIITKALPMNVYPGSGNLQTGYGRVNMEFYTITGVTYQIDKLEVVELDKIYTREDLLKSLYAMGGVVGVTVQPSLAHFTPNFQASSGSSWVLDNTNLYLVGSASGNSYHYYMSSGNSYTNFMAEVEVKGASGMRVGLMTGATDVWYSSNTALKTSSDTIEERFIRSRITRTPVAEWLITKPDTWYKLRLIKRNKELFWLIEDKLFDYTIGNSFLNSAAVNIGVHSLRSSGVAGATLHFRNFKISSLGDIVDTVRISPNTKISSLVDRYLPEDFAISPLGNGYEIYKFGTSRGQHDVSLSSILDFSQSRDDVSTPVVIAAEGESGLANYRKTGNLRKAKQADIADTTLLEDLSLKTVDDLKRITDSESLSTGRRLASFKVTVPLIPMLDTFDTVGISSLEANLAGNFHVQSMRKTYTPADGSFIHDLVLSYGPTQL